MTQANRSDYFNEQTKIAPILAAMIKVCNAFDSNLVRDVFEMSTHPAFQKSELDSPHTTSKKNEIRKHFGKLIATVADLEVSTAKDNLKRTLQDLATLSYDEGSTTPYLLSDQGKRDFEKTLEIVEESDMQEILLATLRGLADTSHDTFGLALTHVLAKTKPETSYQFFVGQFVKESNQNPQLDAQILVDATPDLVGPIQAEFKAKWQESDKRSSQSELHGYADEAKSLRKKVGSYMDALSHIDAAFDEKVTRTLLDNQTISSKNEMTFR